MHWIYILECHDGYIYIGETTRLFTRMWEHSDGRGGLNTELHPPKKILAIYKIDSLGKFLEYNDHVDKANKKELKYDMLLLRTIEDIEKNRTSEFDNLKLENYVVEYMMHINKDYWTIIRGGRYVKSDIEYSFPKNNILKDLPKCYCNLPCTIRYNTKKKTMFFICPVNNFFSTMIEKFETEEIELNLNECKFYSEYHKDRELKIEYEKSISKETDYEQQDNRIILFQQLYAKSKGWIFNLPDGNYDFCVGGCGRKNVRMIKWKNSYKSVCHDCFIYKNDELKEKYEIAGPHLVKHSNISQ